MEEKGLKLRQETKYPEQQGTSLTLTADKPVQMAMRLRVPGWLESAPTVKINGRALEASADPGSYLTIKRHGRTGDRIEMELPMSLRDGGDAGRSARCRRSCTVRWCWPATWGPRD